MYFNTVTYLYVHNGGEISGFFQVVNTLVLHELANNLIGHLVAPFVDGRHIDVVNEDGHVFSSWRAIGAAHSLVNVALNASLLSILQR